MTGGLLAAAAAGRAVGAIRRGLDAPVFDGVRRAPGRGPRDFAAFVEEAAATEAWRA